MHVAKKNGLRLICFTEDEFSKVMSGFDSLKARRTTAETPVELDAESLLVEALTILATDDGQPE